MFIVFGSVRRHNNNEQNQKQRLLKESIKIDAKIRENTPTCDVGTSRSTGRTALGGVSSLSRKWSSLQKEVRGFSRFALFCACSTGVSSVIVARIMHPCHAVWGIVCGVDITCLGVDRLGISRKGVPAQGVIGGVAAIDGGFGVHVVWANGKLCACPPSDVALFIAVHEVDAWGVLGDLFTF